MIIDSHAHIFPKAVIENVSAKPDLAKELDLQIERAQKRLSVADLTRDAGGAGVEVSLLLPTATRDNVEKVNRAFQELTQVDKSILTAGTLHPLYPDNAKELERFRSLDIRAIKFCSFSQGFDLGASGTRDLFDLIQHHNQRDSFRFFVVLDTFFKADRYFGTPKAYLTTPERLGRLAKDFPDIDFVGAHMGGLAAPFDEVLAHLPAGDNLYLGTSNAAHTLTEEEFVILLKRHGPERVLFGTDWPWFDQREEMERIDRLLDAAEFNAGEKARVFGGNAVRLLGMAE